MTAPDGPCKPSSWQQHTSDASSDSCTSSSDGSDVDEDSCSDMTGIRSSAVSVSCDNIRLQPHRSGTDSTTSYPHRSAVQISSVAVLAHAANPAIHSYVNSLATVVRGILWLRTEVIVVKHVV